MAVPYLIANPPARRQFRARQAKVTGCITVHTAESPSDTVGPDDGVDNVAAFIRRRPDPGSYHVLADSDSWRQLVPYALAAYGDGTGSNEYAIHVSAATQAARWPSLSERWRIGCVLNMARAAADAAIWVRREHGITVPARRITKAESDRGYPGFIAHGERDPSRRSDPGAEFPWPMFLAEFARLMDAAFPPPRPAPKPVKVTRLDTIRAGLTALIRDGKPGRPRTRQLRDSRAALPKDDK